MTEDQKQATLARVFNVVVDHSVHNWDGYGAIPVSAKTHEACISFVHAIADHAQPTDIVPDPDGEVSFVPEFAGYGDGVSVC